MAIAMMIDNPDGSQELYDIVISTLGLEKPAGGRVHVAGPSPAGGWRVVEVWDSVEHATSFLRERLAPALDAAGYTGAPPEPQFWPVHNLVTASSPAASSQETAGRT